jgi:hypothetical protein
MIGYLVSIVLMVMSLLCAFVFGSSIDDMKLKPAEKRPLLYTSAMLSVILAAIALWVRP